MNKEDNSNEDISGVPNFPEDLYATRDIVVLGESAHGEHYETILNFIDNFSNKFNTLLIELPSDYQDSVDTYISSGAVDAKLENFFVGAEKEGKHIRGLLEVFEKAKLAGKKIVCIDSSKTKSGEYQNESTHGRYFLRGGSRDEDMYENLLRNTSNSEKVMVIVGANHSQEGVDSDGEPRLGLRLRNQYGEKFAQFTLPDRDASIEEGR